MKLSLQPCRRWRAELLLAAGLLLAVSLPARDCLPAPANLVGWWPGDGSATDIAGTNNGILEAGATANAVGLVGQAFHFDGTNNYVQIPDSSVFHPTNLTVEYWVKFTSLDSQGSGGSPAGDQYIVFKQNSYMYNFEGFDLRKIRISGNDVFKLAVSSATNGTAETAELHATNVVVMTNVWYHVAGVRGSNFIQIYVDGQLEGQTNVNFPQNYGTNALYFGTSGVSYWDHKLYGVLDEVSLYNRALASNEVAAIYAAGAAGKCKGTNGVNITVQPQSQTAVSGTNVVLTVAAAGVAPLSYQWQFNGAALAGATSTNLTLAGVQSTNSGSYQVVVSNPAGSVISAVAVLTVVVAPAITAQPTNQTVLVGSAVDFSVTASGTAPLNYQWQWNGTNLDGAESQALSLTNAQPEQAGSYCVVVSNAGGSVTSALAVLTVLVPPAITVPPTNQTVLAGATASFSVTASGTSPLDYQWQWNGTNLNGAVSQTFSLTNLNGAASQTLNLTNVQAEQAGSYAVMVSNAGGSTTSAVAVLTVLVPPTVTMQPSNQTVLAGAAASFSVTASGTTPLDYQWQWNGTNLNGAASQILSLTNVQPAQAGSYAVMVSNDGGSATSAVAVLTVVGPPMLLNPRITGDGAFALTIAGATGLAYVIEVTTNFEEWTPVSSVTNETGQADFIDSGSSNSVSRFYRASWAP